MKRSLLMITFLVIILSLILFPHERGEKFAVKSKGDKTIRLYKNAYALIIGNGNYKKKIWDKLPGALKDVEDVAIDIVVSREPPPVGGEAYPVSKASLLAPWIAAGVVLSGGTSWYVLRRRKAQS